MGRGRRGLLDELAILPWPVGLVVGVLGFGMIRHGLPAWFSGQSGPLALAFANSNPFAPLAWLVLAACALASLFSWLGVRRNRRLLDTRDTLDSLSAPGWRDFERLVGEAFRRQGYTVEETGLGGADGGIDLVLCKGGQRILVQCKQWRRRKVPVNVVREMYGLLAHHGADEVRIAALGGFTPDAARFAAGKPIGLIGGDELLAMIRTVQQEGVQVPRVAVRIEPRLDAGPVGAMTPACPKCGTAMVQRTNRRDGSRFWGCTSFPACRGTR